MARLFVTLQYLLPHHLLTRLVYAASRARSPWLKNLLIRAFVRHYRPRLDEAVEPDPARYPSFNAFFTRALKPESRPLDPNPRCISSPCDGTLIIAASMQGRQRGLLLQAKRHRYSLEALLGGDASCARQLNAGSYATLYLAPHNYHRVHMPLAGRLRSAWHVPGRLFSVNAATAARVPGLFARNERVICVFDADFGMFAVVLVGALFVGSMSTVWHGQITPWRQVPGQRAMQGVHRLEPIGGIDPWQPRGAELGRFNMGSTVILLLPAQVASWDNACPPGSTVHVGQCIGALEGALEGSLR